MVLTEVPKLMVDASKAFTGLDRESAHPLQLHAVKRSNCTAANPGATGRLSPSVGMISGLDFLPPAALKMSDWAHLYLS